MPRFFFHLVGDRKREADEVGLDFPSLEAAYLDAFAAARDIWCEMLFKRQDPTLYAFEITNDTGLILMDMPFVEILQPAWGRRDVTNAPRAVSNRASRAKRLSGELAAEIEHARVAVLRSREILSRSVGAQPARIRAVLE